MHMPTNQLVNVSEVADMLGISKRTVHQRIGAGRIAPIQKMPGQTGQYLFDRAYIEQIAADERDATQRRSALAAAPSAPEDYVIQDDSWRVHDVRFCRGNPCERADAPC